MGRKAGSPREGWTFWSKAGQADLHLHPDRSSGLVSGQVGLDQNRASVGWLFQHGSSAAQAVEKGRHSLQSAWVLGRHLYFDPAGGLRVVPGSLSCFRA